MIDISCSDSSNSCNGGYIGSGSKSDYYGCRGIRSSNSGCGFSGSGSNSSSSINSNVTNNNNITNYC